jgi:uncharacterized protein (TIGR02001 family)
MKGLQANVQLCIFTLLMTSFIPIASAVEGLSGNVALTNNYLWRGLEQNNGESAVSGGLDFSASSGFYVGTWVSNASWSAGMN